MSVTVKILKAFLPFTVGQALVVEIADARHLPTSPDLPSVFLLKLYDRKFTKTRRRAWNEVHEQEMRSTLLGVIRGTQTCPPLRGLGGRGQDKEGEVWKEIAYAYGRNLGLAFQVSLKMQ